VSYDLESHRNPWSWTLEAIKGGRVVSTRLFDTRDEGRRAADQLLHDGYSTVFLHPRYQRFRWLGKPLWILWVRVKHGARILCGKWPRTQGKT
jgi:hypothetical protein